MALQVARGGVVVGVAVADDLHRHVGGVTPAEAVGEVAHVGHAGGIDAGGHLADRVVDVQVDAGEEVRVAAKAELGVLHDAVDLDLGHVGGHGGRHGDAVELAIGAGDQRDGGVQVVVGGSGRVGHVVGDGLVKVVVADHRGIGVRAGVDAVKRRQIQRAGEGTAGTVAELLQHAQLVLLIGAHELVRDTGAVLELDGGDGYAAQGRAANGLSAVFGHDVGLLVQGESEDLLAGEGDGLACAQTRQGGMAGHEIHHAADQFRGKVGAHGKCCHSNISFSVCGCCHSGIRSFSRLLRACSAARELPEAALPSAGSPSCRGWVSR